MTTAMMKLNSSERNKELERRTKLNFPAMRNLLWNTQPTGNDVLVHPTHYRDCFVSLEEQTLHLTQRLAWDCRSSAYACMLKGSVKKQTDGEGLSISIERLDVKPHFNTSTFIDDGELCIPFTLKKDGTEVDSVTSDEYSHIIKYLHNSCISGRKIELKNFVTLRAFASCHKDMSGVSCRLTMDLLMPSNAFKASPINEVPIVMTALSKSLTEPCNISESSEQTKSGYLTMDHGKNLLLVLESDPKVFTLPLVGIWISGVSAICDSSVWAACLRYVYSTSLQDKVCKPPENFLVVLYSPVYMKPQFYQFTMCGRTSDLNISIYTSHSTIFLPETLKNRNFNRLDLEMNKVESGDKANLFHSALHENRALLSNKLKPTSCKKTVGRLSDINEIHDEMTPRKSPAPYMEMKSTVMPKYSELTISFLEEEYLPALDSRRFISHNASVASKTILRPEVMPNYMTSNHATVMNTMSAPRQQMLPQQPHTILPTTASNPFCNPHGFYCQPAYLPQDNAMPYAAFMRPPCNDGGYPFQHQNYVSAPIHNHDANQYASNANAMPVIKNQAFYSSAFNLNTDNMNSIHHGNTSNGPTPMNLIPNAALYQNNAQSNVLASNSRNTIETTNVNVSGSVQEMAQSATPEVNSVVKQPNANQCDSNAAKPGTSVPIPASVSSSIPLEVMQFIQQQNEQLRELKEQVSQLLSKQSQEKCQETSTIPTSHAEITTLSVPKQTTSIATNTSFEFPGDVNINKNNNCTSHSGCSACSNVNVAACQNQAGEMSRATGISTCNLTPEKDDQHSPDRTILNSLSFENLQLSRIQEQAQESMLSQMLIDIPDMSPDRTTKYDSSGFAESEEDQSAMVGESVSFYDQPPMQEFEETNGSGDTGLGDTGLGDSHPDSSLLFKDQRQYYQKLLGNIQKVLQYNLSSKDNSGHATDKSEEVEIYKIAPDLQGTSETIDKEETIDFEQMTKKKLLEMSIDLSRLASKNTTLRGDESLLMLDTAMLPTLNYVSLMLDHSNDVSSCADDFSMKYLSDQHLAELAVLRLGSQKQGLLSKSATKNLDNILSETPYDDKQNKFGLSANNMSFATKKFMETYFQNDDKTNPVSHLTGEHKESRKSVNVKDVLNQFGKHFLNSSISDHSGIIEKDTGEKSINSKSSTTANNSTVDHVQGYTQSAFSNENSDKRINKDSGLRENIKASSNMVLDIKRLKELPKLL